MNFLDRLRVIYGENLPAWCYRYSVNEHVQGHIVVYGTPGEFLDDVLADLAKVGYENPQIRQTDHRELWMREPADGIDARLESLAETTRQLARQARLFGGPGLELGSGELTLDNEQVLRVDGMRIAMDEPHGNVATEPGDAIVGYLNDIIAERDLNLLDTKIIDEQLRLRQEFEELKKERDDAMNMALERPQQAPPDSISVGVCQSGSYVDYWELHSRFHREFIEAIKSNIDAYRDDMVMRTYDKENKAWMIHRSQTAVMLVLLNRFFKFILMTKEAEDRVPGYSKRRLKGVSKDNTAFVPESEAEAAASNGGRSRSIRPMDESPEATIDEGLYSKIIDNVMEGASQ